jgi:protein-tyrosine phosphatase
VLTENIDESQKVFGKTTAYGTFIFYLLSFICYFCGMKILMVCLGNICRSPLAEGILQQKAFAAGLAWSVESAGTNSYHTGEPPHPLSQKVAKLNGIDISKQRARRFSAQDFETYDKIYALANDVMDEIKRIAKNKFDASKVELFMNELYPGKDMDVPDPWYGTEPGYHEVYKTINEVCEEIVRKASPNPARGGALQDSKILK